MEAEFDVEGQTPEFDEVFLDRYESIYKWGMLITKHDHELAEDLVHDVYMRFMGARKNLTGIDCFDNYFFIALRNSYISYLRRTPQQKQLAVIEFDLVDNALLAIDPQHQLEVHESLRAICKYACVRKKTSISASVLILRFFHGYFPSEVAKILKSSRNAVEVHIVLARREAIAYLNNPNSLHFVAQDSDHNQLTRDHFRGYQNTIEVLLNTIFAAREGDCLEPTGLNKIYQSFESNVPRNVLSHIVSCPFCLSAINKLLELPPLSERHPLDTLGKEINGNKNRLGGAKELTYTAK